MQAAIIRFEDGVKWFSSENIALLKSCSLNVFRFISVKLIYGIWCSCYFPSLFCTQQERRNTVKHWDICSPYARMT